MVKNRVLMVAAALAVVAVLSVAQWSQRPNSDGRASASSREIGEPAAGLIVSSGTNYHPSSVAGAVTTLLGGGAQVRPSISNAPTPAVGGGVQGLRGSRLISCVALLTGKVGVVPLAVDLARFDGEPSGVVLLPDGENRQTVGIWVVGPQCGVGSADDVRFYATAQRP
jgi:hypothetical protein